MHCMHGLSSHVKSGNHILRVWVRKFVDRPLPLLLICSQYYSVLDLRMFLKAVCKDVAETRSLHSQVLVEGQHQCG